MTTRRARAMLIGIEEYKLLGTDKHLRAGKNDVLAFWKVCRRLGFDPQNIHVFTTPVLTKQDLLWAEQEIGDELPEPKNADEIKAMVDSWFPPNGERPKVFLEEATRANIMGPEGLDWIAKPVAGPGEPPVDRILTYSGHGARVENTLALCPSDVRQEGALQNAILIDDFKKALQDVDDNLTVVLDCCFAQTSARPSGAHRHASISAGVADKPLHVDLGGLGPRVFCASGPNESSYQALLGGYWYSAFSWAMTVVLEQWRICGKHKPHSTISHTELLFRARMLLGALSFPQTPVLLGPVSDKPVFGHGDDTEETAPGPNAPRGSGQIDPSQYGFAEYQFCEVVNGQEMVLATVVATNKTDEWQNTGMVRRVEYWKIENGSSLDTLRKSSIKVKQTKAKEWNGVNEGRPSFNAASAHFTCDVDASWVADHERLTYHSNNGIGFYIAVSKNSNTGVWGGQIFFVQPANSNKLLFGDNGVNGLSYEKVTNEKSRSLCNRIITPVTSGSTAYLWCETKGVYVRNSHSWGSSEYVFTDPAQKKAHVLKLVDDRTSPSLQNGDRIYIQYQADRSNIYMSSTNSTDIWYNKDVGIDEQWTIEKVSVGDEFIRRGDQVRIKNVGENGYLQAKGTNDYVNLGGSQTWRLE